jgi:uncharacterized protein (DUF1015 family)
MVEISAFSPLCYDLGRLPEGLGPVVAPPYDVISPEQRVALADRHPHNIVRLELPEGDGDAKYQLAAGLFARWCREQVFIREPSPCLIRYDQTFAPPGRLRGRKLTRRGFLALVRLVPFADRVVLPHERTLAGPKEDRLKLLRAVRANVSPGFMLYRDPRRQLDEVLAKAEPWAEFATPDEIHHRVARVRDRAAIHSVVEGLRSGSLLIADGHHRYETALRYAQEVSADHLSAPDDAEHRYFMCYLVNGDDPDLVVFPTHRHVHSLPSFSFEHLLESVSAAFCVEELGQGADADTLLAALKGAARRGPCVVATARDGRGALLTLRSDIDLARHATLGKAPEVLRRTDVAVLHAGVLEHVLGITPEAQAAKTNLWYPQDAAAALAALRSGKGNVLFLMNATPVSQVREVAEAGEVMPQKSTFFYPKVLTGLALHTLDPGRRIPAI